MDSKETKTIRLSVLILALALIFVYVLRFYVKGDMLSDLVNSDVNNSLLGVNQQLVTNSTQFNIKENEAKPVVGESSELVEENNIVTVSEVIIEESEGVIDPGPLQVVDNRSGNGLGEEILDTDFQPTLVNERKILPGTDLYYGKLDPLDSLAINPEYILQDSKGIQYALLSDVLDTQGLENIARSLSGDIYILATEQDIINNQLFGDRVVFVNIPKYKNKKVLMLVDIDDENWFIVIDYTVYYQSKGYMRDLFID